MTVIQDHPSLQLFQQVFPEEEQRKTYQALSTYLEQGGSIFPLVEKGTNGLVRDFGLSLADAERYLRRANALAIYIRRQFIEHTLAGDETAPTKPLSGIMSMVPGPSFDWLFGTNFDNLCPPDALEAITSPVAYLIVLLKWLMDRIESTGDDTIIPLMERRTDLRSLLIDHQAVHKQLSAVEIIYPVLETFIKAHSKEPVDVDEATSTARYPNGLPYHRDWTSIDFVARQYGLLVGGFARTVDISTPYFLQPDAGGGYAARALIHDSRLGPYQRELLIETPNASEDSEQRARFYKSVFGTDDLDWQNLNQVSFFCQRTKLDSTALEALLSVGSFAPVRSPNAPPDLREPSVPSAAQSGAVYLNGGENPPIGIVFRREGAGALNRLTELAQKPARYDRMNRKIRLDHWLGLDPEKVDRLLVAAINAEVPVATDPAIWISENTLRAIGLFQSLSTRFSCTAEDFAVFIHELSIYGRGEESSQFDQIFNPPSYSSDPLKLDGGDFPVNPVPGQETYTVLRICTALGISLQTYGYLAQAIATALGAGQTLKRDSATLSSFYRLVKLPRLLGITPVEGVVLLKTLGGDSWVKALAGIPALLSEPLPDRTDALNVIQTLDECVRWCRVNEMPVSWVLMQVVFNALPTTASSEERQFFDRVRVLSGGALFSDTGLSMAGVPLLAAGSSWLDFMTLLVDRDGLVITQPEAVELDYPNYARKALDRAVNEGVGEVDENLRALIIEQMLGVLLEAKTAQESVVRECLAIFASMRSELVILVLGWAQGTVYQVLRHVLDWSGEREEAAAYGRRAEEEEKDGFLVLLADVRRRGAVIAKLDLSVELLQDYLSYGYRVWLAAENKYEFSLRTLYYLTVLKRAFAIGGQPAAALLDYLREINDLPDPLTGDALQLAQQTAAIQLALCFSWSVQEVRESAQRIEPVQGLIKNLIQLDALLRVRELAADSGMDAETIYLMGNLPSDIDREIYSRTAEHALLQLMETPEPVIAVEANALNELVRTTCVVDRDRLIARKKDEVATYTVTVHSPAGKALSGVNVYFQTSLGGITSQVATSISGVAHAQLTPGDVLGTASAHFWLDLHEKQQAPSVEIGVDSATLSFPGPLKSAVPDGVVPANGEVELYAVMMDRYGNVAVNQPVVWSSISVDGSGFTPIWNIRPREALTNLQGITRAFLSSVSGGKFEAQVASLRSGEIAVFDVITFAENDSAG